MKIETFKSEGGYTVRCGHANVRIRPIARGRYTTWRLAWKIGKKTFRRAYNDETKALSEAERIARSLCNANGAATTVAGDDIVYFNECRKKLGEVPLHVAVDFYLKLNGSASSSKTLDETWGEFLRELEHRQLSDRHIQTSRCLKKTLSPLFGERRVSNLQPAEIAGWLNTSKYSPVTKVNIFKSFSAVMRFSRKRGYTNRAINELLQEVQIAAPKGKTPTFYSPEDLKKIFISCPSKETALYVATMAFGGARRAEFERLKGQAILFDEKMIRLGPEITKTHTGRTLDICENFEAWLKTTWNGDAGLLKKSKNSVCAATWNLGKIGVEAKPNALRHSFCSYHLALHRNAAMTAELAGNSPVVLNKFYKALVSKKSAEEWFAVTPESVRGYAKEIGLEKLITW